MSAAEVLHGIAVAFDDVIASIAKHGQTDLTVSSLCGIALMDDGNEALQILGRELNRVQPGHCDQAILGDYARAEAAMGRLAPYVAKIKKE